MPEKRDIDMEFLDCLRTILDSGDPKKVDKAWNLLEEMENHLSDSNKSTYDEFLRTILTDGYISNIQEIPQLLEWFSKFPFPDTASNPISDDIACFLMNSARRFKDEPYLCKIIQVIRDNADKYLPQHNNHTQLCEAIVEVLSWMSVPMDSNKIAKYEEDLIEIRNFLKEICENGDNRDNIAIKCFRQMCKILLASDRKEPSSALVIILQLANDNLWNQYMRIAVRLITDQCKDESKIVHMLSLFCQWLIQPPYTRTEYLSMWLRLFILALDEIKMQRISAEVAEIALPTIFPECLKLEKFYKIDVDKNVVLLLLSRIRSLNLYHTIVTAINCFFNNSKVCNVTCNNRKKVVETIVKHMRKLYNHFQEHLEHHCEHCLTMSKLISVIPEINQSFNSYIPEENEEMEHSEISYPSTSNGLSKFSSGKVGLFNLGNTCYMNSVLQALFMTRQFCNEVLSYKISSDSTEQIVLRNLQNLFALLNFSTRNSLAPTEILHVSRPAYFISGQQQDSSEFLCYLLDVMYEQEKAAIIQNSNSDQCINTQNKVEDKEIADVEEVPGTSNSLFNDDGTSPNMSRWTTEENLSEGGELAQTRNALSDSHSDSTDSGIQSVGGEDSSSSSASSVSTPLSSSYLVHRVFGGELKVTYQCVQCGTESHNTDRFRDLQLCFLENLEPKDAIRVQDLINLNYFQPEKLTGDNKYRCEKCAKLCDAQRIIKILQVPEHLILTLKHFRYDSESGLRTKLSRRVIYDDTIHLPVLDKANETYRLYAAVVHSGYSMDYGHYMTYACDANNRWYNFNDSFVTETTVEEFKRLEPPNTPYILFYKRCTDATEEETPDLKALSQNLQAYVDNDRRWQAEEHRNSRPSMSGLVVSPYNSQAGCPSPPNNCDFSE